MTGHEIPLDKAELLSTLLEALLYGFSLLMFGGTIWVLLQNQRSTHRVNHKMVAVACSLLLFSTAHFVIDIIRIMQGLILYRDIYPDGPANFFSDPSQWTFVYKNYIYTIQTLIGDGVMLYRCYAVWQSRVVMILPCLLWCSVAVTGIGAPYTGSQVSQGTVFSGGLAQWITAFYASTFMTNLLTTLLLACRIWYVDRKTTGLRVHRNSQLRPILHVIIDAGAIYSVILLAALVCFANQSNGQYVILDMVMPIISITFYMVIIRVGLANRTNQRMDVHPLEYALSRSSDRERTRGMQVHITTLTENKVDSGPATTVANENRRCAIKMDSVQEVV